jgi:hypothetical protein
MRYRHIVLASLLTLVVNSLAQAQGYQEPPLFPLLGTWPPPATEAMFKRYADAHLNMIALDPDQATAEALELASRSGLGVLIAYNDSKLDPAETPQETAAKGGAVTGCALEGRNWDQLPQREKEPDGQGTGQAPLVVAVPRKTEALFPPEGLLDQLDSAGIKAFAASHFFMYEDGTNDEAAFFASIRNAAAQAQEKDALLWGHILVTQRGPYRCASESDIRLQAYSYLAAGARGLCYSTYWGPNPEDRTPGAAYEGWGEAMVDTATGQPLYAWMKIEQLNREILTLAPHLAKLKAQGIRFVGDVPAGCRPLVPGQTVIENAQAERALIGFLRGPDAKDWTLVVNRRYGKGMSADGQTSVVRLELASNIDHVTEYDRNTGSALEIPIDGGAINLELPGGTGSLLCFNPKPE